MITPQFPKELKHIYDPFDKEHYEKILSHFNVRVWAAYEKLEKDYFWGYVWKYGGVQLCPKYYLSEEMARAATALAIYLYCCEVVCGLDDRLALVLIKNSWFKYHSGLEVQNVT